MQRSLVILFCMVTSSAFADSPKNSADCLARMLYKEARGEPLRGKIAAGYTVMNRLRKSHRSPSTSAQSFSRKDNIMPSGSIPANDYDDYLGLAEDVIAGNVPDASQGATHFNRRAPHWAEVRSRIGGHVFYVVDSDA